MIVAFAIFGALAFSFAIALGTAGLVDELTAQQKPATCGLIFIGLFLLLAFVSVDLVRG